MKNILYITACLALLLASCQSPTPVAQLQNNKASLPASYAISDKRYKVITSFINRKDKTMSTLYGNDIALNCLQNNSKCTPGSQLALVTWAQQEDEHWFGARIPGNIRSVETIKIDSTTNGTTISYLRKQGAQLIDDKDTTGNSSRIAFILAQHASIMP